jgi:uncharacterized delta-60 repeat protein
VASGDGWLDEVHALRQEYAADLVCLVTEFEERNEFAGMATQLADLTPTALAAGFTVCLRPFLIGNYTLPHEVGHLLGCNHDRDTARGGGLETWSHGTRILVEGVEYRTVMAYRPGLQFPHFSNPRVTFRGVATGVAEGPLAADNVRTLNRTAPLIAGVREPSHRVGWVSDQMAVSESAGTLKVQFQHTGIGEDGEFSVRTVAISAREGVDYVGIDQRVVIGSEAEQQGVDLVILGNSLVDGPRQLLLEMVRPSWTIALGPVATTTITILDDEPEIAAALDTGFQSRPGADYLVTSLARTSEGDLLAAGGFATFNDESHRRIVRLRADGRPDPAFQAEVKYRVDALAVFPDGRIALGGDFNTVNGVRLNHVAILLPDGGVDPSFQFDPGTDEPVSALAALPEGRLMIGGAFTMVHGGPALRVARLLPSGRLDPDFTSQEGPEDQVYALAVSDQERVIVGGSFRMVGARVCPGIARLEPDGTLDDTFSVAGESDGAVYCLAVDSTGGIMVGGDFTRLGGRQAGRLIRLLDNGTPDPEFSSGEGADGPVLSIVKATTGGWWIGGGFTRFNGADRRRVARLHPNGELDVAFDPGVGPNDWVLAVAPSGEDSLAIGGLFTAVNGVVRGGLASLLTGPIHAPRFLSVAVVDNSLEWSAYIHPRQAYELEAAERLGDWRGIGVLRPMPDETESRLNGRVDRLSGTNAFLRLKRHLE